MSFVLHLFIVPFFVIEIDFKLCVERGKHGKKEESRVRKNIYALKGTRINVHAKITGEEVVPFEN